MLQLLCHELLGTQFSAVRRAPTLSEPRPALPCLQGSWTQIHSDSEMSFQNAEVPTNLSSAKGGKLQKQDPAGNKGSEKSFSFVKAFLFKEILTDTSKGFA